MYAFVTARFFFDKDIKLTTVSHVTIISLFIPFSDQHRIADCEHSVICRSLIYGSRVSTASTTETNVTPSRHPYLLHPAETIHGHVFWCRLHTVYLTRVFRLRNHLTVR